MNCRCPTYHPLLENFHVPREQDHPGEQNKVRKLSNFVNQNRVEDYSSQEVQNAKQQRRSLFISHFKEG